MRKTTLKQVLASPFLILVSSLSLTIAASIASALSVRETHRAQFENAVNAAKDRIDASMATHVAMLHAASGLFAASEVVERDEFRVYVDRLDLAERYPSLQGIGFSRRLDRQPEAAFVVVYLEPADDGNRAMLGYDMWSNAALRASMARARDSGMPSLSGSVALPYAPPALFMYVPVYRAGETPASLHARRTLLDGFTYAAFLIDDLFAVVSRDESPPRISFQVYDGSNARPGRLLHDSRSTAERRHVPAFTARRSVEVAGRHWTVALASTPFFESVAARSAVPITAAVGLMLSFAFFVASRAQAKARATAERAAGEARRFLEQERRAESALHDSSRRVQLIIDALPALVSYVDGEERYRFVNAAYQEWFGRPIDELVGKPLADVLGARAVASLRPHLDQVRAGRSVTFETTLPHANGEVRSIRGVYSPHFSATGVVEGFVVLATDITKQKKAETWQRFLADATRVLTSSLDYKTTLESITRLSVPLIADRCIVYMADAAGRLRQLAVTHRDQSKLDLLREMGARFPFDADAPHGPARVLRTSVPELAAPSAAVIDGYTANPELRAMLRSLDFHALIAVPVRVRDQTVGTIVLASTDPGRRYADEDLRMAEDLSRRAADAIDNAQLYTAAQEAIQLRDEFLSIASHELRTPLTPLQLHLENIQHALQKADGESDLASDTMKRWVDSACRQTRRLVKLVESLLDVSRISSGGLALEPEQFDLSLVAHEVVERFGPDARAAGCALIVHAEQPAEGSWDRLRVEQVLSNLLSNAVKYGAGKPIDVMVKMVAAQVACVIVSDHGIGIAPEDTARIFDRFERAVSLRHYGGMGLGLYIVRQIIEAHAGSIDSTPGGGSTFTVLLPSLQARTRNADDAAHDTGRRELLH